MILTAVFFAVAIYYSIVVVYNNIVAFKTNQTSPSLPEIACAICWGAFFFLYNYKG